MSRFAVLAPALGAVIAFAVPAAADDTPAVEVTVGYHFNALGIGIGEADARFELGEDTYRVTASGRAVGLIDLITRIRVSGETVGRVDGELLRPVIHSYTYSERGKARRVAIGYDAGQVPGVTADPPFNPSFGRVPVPDDRRASTIDPVSLFVLPAVPGAGLLAPEHCNRSVTVFQGQLLLDVTVSHISSAEETTIRGANYEGPLMHCSARVRAVGGHREGDFLSKLETKAPPEMWLAPAADGRYYLPVRLTVPTPFGQAELVARSIAVMPAPARAALGQ